MKRHILTVSILLVAAQLFGQESRFWVGGSGSWTDESHWSTTSGGEPGATVPESGTSVVFDENSFSEARNTVTIKSQASVGSITSTNAVFAVSGKKDLTIGGSVDVDANVDFGKMRGALVLSGSGSHTVNIASEIKGAVIIDGGSWTLASDLTTEGDITLKSGSFNTDGHNVTCAVFSATEDAEELNIENSTMLCDKWFTYSAEKMTVMAGGSDIIMKGDIMTDYRKAKNQHFNAISSYSAAKDGAVYSINAITTNSICPANADNYSLPGTGTVYVVVGDGNVLTNIQLYIPLSESNDIIGKEYNVNKHTFRNVAPGEYCVGYFEIDMYGRETIKKIRENVVVGPDNFTQGIVVIDSAECWSDPIVLGDTISGGTGDYQYNWKLGSTSVGTAQTHTANTANKSYYLEVTDENGCKFTTRPFNYAPDRPGISTYNYPPKIDADFSTTSSCDNNNKGTITITPTGGQGGPYTFSIVGVEGKAKEKGISRTSVTALKSEALPSGTYEIVITDKTGNCTNLSNAPTNIKKATVGEIKHPVALAGDDDSKCEKALSYTVNDADAPNSTSTIWEVLSGPATITSNGDHLNPTISLDGHGLVTLQLTASNGDICADSIDTKIVKVVKTPEPQIIHPVDTIICGLSATINVKPDTDETLTGGTIVLEPVGVPSGVNVDINGMDVEFDKAGDYTFRVKQTDESSVACDGYNATDNNLTLSFYDTPEVKFTSNKGSICVGGQITISATITNQRPVEISWTKNGVLMTGETSASINYTALAGDITSGNQGTVEFVVKVNNGYCDPDTAKFTLTVNKVPSPTVVVDAEVCGTETESASISGRLDNTNSKFEWFAEESGLTFTPKQGDSPKITSQAFTGSATYHIYVKETLNGCSDTSKHVAVTFNEERTLKFKDGTTSGSGNICADAPKKLEITTNCNIADLSWSHDGKGTYVIGDDGSITYTPKKYDPSTMASIDESDEGEKVTISASVLSNVASCSAPAPISFELNVKQMPRPTVSISDIDAAGFVCGLKVEAEAQNTIGGTLSWSWGTTEGFGLTSKTADNKEVELRGPNGVGYNVSVTETTTDVCSGTSDPVWVSFRDSVKIELPKEVDKCVSDIYAEVKATVKNATSVVWSSTNSGGLTQTNDFDDDNFRATRTNTAKYTFDPSDGPVTLKVTATNGVCPVKDKEYKFTVNPIPAPELSDTTEICGPEGEIVATVSDLGNDINWVLPAGVAENGEEIVDAIAKKVRKPIKLSNANNYVQGPVVIIEKNPAGCDTKDTTLVIFKALPVIAFEDKDLNATICAGDTFIVHVKTHENFEEYKWVSSSGVIKGRGDSGVFISDVSTVFKQITISASPKDGCPSDAEAKMTLTINPKPKPEIENDTVCGLTYLWPSVTSVTGIGSNNGWSVRREPEGTINSAAKVTLPFEGTFTVVLDESVGECSTIDSAKVTFVSKPEAFAGNDTVICASETLFELANATASFYNNKVSDSLTWTTSGTGTFVDEFGGDGTHILNPIYKITPADTAAHTVTLTLTAKSRTPCKPADDAEAKITIKINPLPSPKLIGNDMVCANSSHSYTTDAGMSNYVWKVGDDIVANTESLDNYQWGKAGNYDLLVTYTDGNGCEPAKPAKLPITVNKLPGSKLPNVDTVCTNGSIVLNATDSVNTVNPYNYSWTDLGGGSVAELLGGDDNIAMPTFANQEPGTYTLICTIEDGNSCEHKDTIEVTVVPGPVAYAGEDFPVCYGDTAQLHGDFKFADGATWKSLGDAAGIFKNKADTATLFFPGPADWEKGYVTLVLTASNLRCGYATDTVELTLRPELQVAVGTDKPFDIGPSTKISVKIEGEFNDFDHGGYASGIGFYLITPSGDSLKLYDHDDLDGIFTVWTLDPKKFNVEFSTTATDILDMDVVNVDGELEGTYIPTDPWSKIYGMNPAEGGWAIGVGGVGTGVGWFKRAIITFTDHKNNDPTKETKVIRFDSKDKHVYIAANQGLKYISPIGLRETCYGMCDAPAIANGIGGSGVYELFEWSDTEDFSNIIGTSQKIELCRGTYYLRVTDTWGCTATTIVEVSSPDKITIAKDSTAIVSCYGGSDGYVAFSADKYEITYFDFSVAGFNAASTTNNTAIFNTLPLGDYKVIVTDEDNCQDSLDFSITQPDSIRFSAVVTPTPCGTTDGEVQFTIGGGTLTQLNPVYTISCDDPGAIYDNANQKVTNLKGGKITFTITDANGCSKDTTISTMPDPMELSFEADSILCFNGKTNIAVKVNGGDGPYDFVWSNASTDSIATELVAGRYYVDVTDKNGCPASDTITIGQPSQIKDTIIYTQAVKCYGDTVATFYAAVLGGGTSPTHSYNYTWYNVDTNKEIVADSVLANRGEGTYAVKITDYNNCPIYDTVTIVYPDTMYITSIDTVKSECSSPTGSAEVNVTGGYGTYQYYWHSLFSADTVNNQKKAFPLEADIYVVEIEDKLGCRITDTVEILDKGNIEFGEPVTKDVACIQHATGQAMISTVYGLDADGNIDNVFTQSQIIWNNTDTVAQGDTVKTLHYGLNRVVVKAENGCKGVGSVEIGNTLALRVTNIANYPDLTGAPNCDGSLTVTIGGGIGGYTYSWTGNPSESVDDATTTSVYGLCEGDYALHVVDENPQGCEIDTVIHIEHRPLTINFKQNVAAKCYGGGSGLLEAEGVGGYYEPYNYAWTSENWSADSVATTATINGLKAGLYTVIISQSNGRVADTASIRVGQPTTRLHVPDVDIVTTGSHCYDSIGTISIFEPANLAEEFGGNLPFKYYFSHSSWTDSIVLNSGAKPKITGLPTDSFNLLVVDDLGCEFDTVINVADLSQFTITRTDSTAPRCYGYEDGKLAINATSKSSENFTYLWSNGDTTATISGLAAGSYTVTVIDDSQCKKIETFELGQPTQILFSVSSTLVSCYNLNDGTVEITGLQGGSNMYNRFEFFAEDAYYEQTPTVDTSESVISFSNLLPVGDYKVRITDVKSCYSDSVPLRVLSANPEIMVLSVIPTLPTCETYNADGTLSLDGSIALTAMSMPNMYSVSSTVNPELYYSIDGGQPQTNGKFDKLASGRHSIVIGFGDTLSCSTTVSRTLGSRNGFAIDYAYFVNANSSDIFTCPDNELVAFAHTTSAYKSMKWYTPYVEEEEEEEEPVVVPVDTTITDSIPTDSLQQAAFSKLRYIYLRADGDSIVTDSTVIDSTLVNNTDTVEAEPARPKYDIDEDGNVVLGVDSEGSEPENILPFKFMPYGGDTYYYVKAINEVCMAIDSLHAVAMKPDNKLKTHIEMDGFDSEDLKNKNTGVYEVAEGAELFLVANSLTFDMLYSDEYENNFQWATNTDNALWISSHDTLPAIVRPYAEDLTFKVSDSVMFILEDTSFACRYTESVEVRTVSGIKPADVFTPNGDIYNETWEIAGLSSYENVNIYVFNRWGGRVWQFSGSGLEYAANQWNGKNAKNKPLPSGTYYYVIQCSSDKLGGKKKTGPVTIIR